MTRGTQGSQGSQGSHGSHGALVAGLATAIGSLPHTDAGAAAAFALRATPELAAAPQLPNRSALEGMLVQWLRGLPEVAVAPDGSFGVASVVDVDAPVDVAFDPIAHGGLLTFVDVAAAQPRVPQRVKAQLTGPLTLGVALVRAGVPTDIAFRRSTTLARAWARAIERLVRERLPETELVLFFDEPALVLWNDDSPPVDHEHAGDLLSGAFAAVGCATGVHVCGDGDARLALAAGPDVLGIDVSPRWLADAAGLARFLDAGGFIAWGAVPTDRPVGESAAPLWRALVELWCELTRRGCDGVLLRSRALITPTCGLAGHGVSQSEHALALARDLAGRVFDQAAATKLTVGA